MSDNSTLTLVTQIECGATDNEVTYYNIRVASIFVILVTSAIGSLFPVLARKAPWMHVPAGVFEFAKYFGSGVIIATAFIHLLAPAMQELTSPCLFGAWQDYTFAPAIAMAAVFAVFIVEFIAFRWGMAKLESLGISDYEVHGHCAGPSGAMSAHGPEADTASRLTHTDVAEAELGDSREKVSAGEDSSHDGDSHHGGGMGGMTRSGAAQILGVAILEFGIIFHSVIIGLTLAVDPDFLQLFIVIIFHQMFEGLGLGTRLAFLDLPHSYRHAPIIGCIAFSIITPLGIAIGLGVSSTYNPGSTIATIVSGVLDSTSAGVLLYTGLVELLAHEFLFNQTMLKASNGRVAYALICMLVGAGVMALLGRWA